MGVRRKATASLGADRLTGSAFDARSYPGLLAWWDARYVNGFGSANPSADAMVASWTDLSGNGRTLTQGADTSKPLFRTAGGGGTNYPRVDFDGTNDYLSAATTTGLHLPISGYMVIKDDVTTGGMVVEVSTNINTQAGWYYYSPYGYTMACRDGTNTPVGFDATGTDTWAGTNPIVVSFSMGSGLTYFSLTKNGAVQSITKAAGTTYSSPSSSQPIYVGARSGPAYPWNGSLGCMALYSGIHSATDRAAIEAGLMSAFAIT